MMACSKNRFRTNNDLTQYIYRYWDLATQNFTPYKYNDGLAMNISSAKHLQKIFSSIMPNINFICLNDSFKLLDSEFNEIKTVVEEALENRFTKPASFEK